MLTSTTKYTQVNRHLCEKPRRDLEDHVNGKHPLNKSDILHVHTTSKKVKIADVVYKEKRRKFAVISLILPLW